MVCVHVPRHSSQGSMQAHNIPAGPFNILVHLLAARQCTWPVVLCIKISGVHVLLACHPMQAQNTGQPALHPHQHVRRQRAGRSDSILCVTHAAGRARWPHSQPHHALILRLHYVHPLLQRLPLCARGRLQAQASEEDLQHIAQDISRNRLLYSNKR